MAEQMKAFVMKKIGEVGWITKDRPECGQIYTQYTKAESEKDLIWF